MTKQSMSRSDRTHAKAKNEVPFVPELQNKAKSGNLPDKPIISGTSGPNQKAIHAERLISKAYREIDNDLAQDNMENDLPDADLQDL